MALLEDGHPTKHTFALNGAIKFAQKTVTPPGAEGGGENDVTTMDNILLRTRAPKHLVTMTPASANVAYDPQVIEDIFAMINKNQLITTTHSDGSQWQWWGWLDEFKPNENSDGEQPTADVVMIPSNRNDSGAETIPVFVAAA